METILGLLFLGFLLGIAHAFEADHMIAISSLVARTKNIKKSSLLGAIWGVGHTTMLLIVGIAVLATKAVISQNIALSFEFIVGLMLVVLGLSNIFGFKHLHKHVHSAREHLHLHFHKSSHKHRHEIKSLAVGMVHGLAGSAALTLLVLATVESIYQGIFYILVFGFGSVLGMFIVSSLISLPFMAIKKFEKISNGLETFAGAVSIIFGLIVMAKVYGSL
ncbi:MAG: sulfite exporter TauE/SafE family protein [Candidatus Aenigmarchaeota archaeon]|nr:sulfite exporter TauE/SafE family protein [Candidatus Aenigmarchaeota archaeon]